MKPEQMRLYRDALFFHYVHHGIRQDIAHEKVNMVLEKKKEKQKTSGVN